MIEIMVFGISGFIIACVCLFATPNEKNQVTDFTAAVFWISVTLFVVSTIIMIDHIIKNAI